MEAGSCEAQGWWADWWLFSQRHENFMFTSVSDRYLIGALQAALLSMAFSTAWEARGWEGGSPGEGRAGPLEGLLAEALHRQSPLRPCVGHSESSADLPAATCLLPSCPPVLLG